MESNFSYPLYLSASEILGLPALSLKSALTSVSIYDMDERKIEGFSPEDIELYVKVVEHQFPLDKSANNVKSLGFLPEQLGLEILKTKSIWRLEDVKPYEMPQSHIDYINTLTSVDKSGLKNTFFEKYITTEFVATTVREEREILILEGTPYINLGTSSAVSSGVLRNATTMGKNYSSTTKGYLFGSMDQAELLVEKIVDFEFAINLTKEKLKWEAGESRSSKFYNVPNIVPSFSSEKKNYTVAGIWGDARAEFTASPVIDVTLEGSVDQMFYAESESIYASDYSTNNQRQLAATEMNIPLTEGTYVPKGKAKEVYEKVRENLAAEESENNIRVKQALAAKELVGVLSFENRCDVFVTVVLEYEDGFTYLADSKNRYTNNIDTVLDWIATFRKEEIEDSYDWTKKRDQFLADQEDLPKV